jgi:hypothetical protein
MHLRHICIYAAAVAFTAAPAFAGHIVPGLWETHVEPTSEDPYMAKLPPALKAQMKAGATARLCITPQQAAREDFAFSRTSSCKVENMQSSGGALRADILCSRGKVTIKTHYDIRYDSMQHYSGTITMETDANGKQTVRTSKLDAHFVSADCGGVKPIEIPAQ